MNKETYTLFSPEENIYYFESKGIKIKTPYSDLLPYLKDFQSALQSQEKIEIKSSDVSETSEIPLPLGGSLMQKPALKKLGQFYPSAKVWVNPFSGLSQNLTQC